MGQSRQFRPIRVASASHPSAFGLTRWRTHRVDDSTRANAIHEATARQVNIVTGFVIGTATETSSAKRDASPRVRPFLHQLFDALTTTGTAAYAAWIVILVVWTAGIPRRKPTVYRSTALHQHAASILILVSFVLLFVPFKAQVLLGYTVTPQTPPLVLTGVLLAWIGAVFAIWARVSLGRNWSGGAATIKLDHELLQSGPYRLVRHPIYTGFIAAMVGTALATGRLGPYLAVVWSTAGFLIRIRHEERLMTAQFRDTYAAYQARTRILIPFLW
jgi:protein-S-isoprenylcysteine O-methyltransferase